jgi:CheY-like chemotaxis protein
MNSLVTKDSPIHANKLKKADEHFHKAVRAAAVGEPIVIAPDDHTHDRLLRVLIVDDHRATAKTLSSLVTIWGHDVRCAYDGATALALAAAFRPDVLLLDMMMPDVSGFEVAMQVRRQNRLHNCFIIAITGRTDAKHRNRSYEAGADLFLIKPVAPSNMQTLLGLESAHVNQLTSYAAIGLDCSELAAMY